MKNAVSSASLDTLAVMVVMRMKPKSASMAWGGLESVIRIFDWEGNNSTTKSSVRVRWLTGLMFPCAMLQLWRYLTPWPHLEAVQRWEARRDDAGYWWNT